jgi:hypothetical protein
MEGAAPAAGHTADSMTSAGSIATMATGLGSARLAGTALQSAAKTVKTAEEVKRAVMAARLAKGLRGVEMGAGGVFTGQGINELYNANSELPEDADVWDRIQASGPGMLQLALGGGMMAGGLGGMRQAEMAKQTVLNRPQPVPKQLPAYTGPRFVGGRAGMADNANLPTIDLGMPISDRVAMGKRPPDSGPGTPTDIELGQTTTLPPELAAEGIGLGRPIAEAPVGEKPGYYPKTDPHAVDPNPALARIDAILGEKPVVEAAAPAPKVKKGKQPKAQAAPKPVAAPGEVMPPGRPYAKMGDKDLASLAAMGDKTAIAELTARKPPVEAAPPAEAPVVPEAPPPIGNVEPVASPAQAALIEELVAGGKTPEEAITLVEASNARRAEVTTPPAPKPPKAKKQPKITEMAPIPAVEPPPAPTPPPAAPPAVNPLAEAFARYQERQAAAQQAALHPKTLPVKPAAPVAAAPGSQAERINNLANEYIANKNKETTGKKPVTAPSPPIPPVEPVAPVAPKPKAGPVDPFADARARAEAISASVQGKPGTVEPVAPVTPTAAPVTPKPTLVKKGVKPEMPAPAQTAGPGLTGDAETIGGATAPRSSSARRAFYDRMHNNIDWERLHKEAQRDSPGYKLEEAKADFELLMDEGSTVAEAVEATLPMIDEGLSIMSFIRESGARAEGSTGAAPVVKPATPVAKPAARKMSTQDFIDDLRKQYKDAEADVRFAQKQLADATKDPLKDANTAAANLSEAEAARDALAVKLKKFAGKDTGPSLDSIRTQVAKGEERLAALKKENPEGNFHNEETMLSQMRALLNKIKSEKGSAVHPPGMVKTLMEELADRLKSVPRSKKLGEVEPFERPFEKVAESLEVVDDSATTMNASGESKASAEAISRGKKMKVEGQEFGIVSRDGRFRRLLDQDALDSYTLKPGETKIVRGQNGKHTVLDGDGQGMEAFNRIDARQRGGEGGFFRLGGKKQTVSEMDAEIKRRYPNATPEQTAHAQKVYRAVEQFKDWVNGRSAAKFSAELKAKEFKSLDSKGMEGIHEFESGIRTGKYAEVQEYFDTAHERAIEGGLRMGFRENYLPLLFEHTSKDPNVVLQAARRLKLKPEFTLHRVLENYKALEGVEGIKPKFTKVSELVNWYERTLERALTDRKFFNYLRHNEFLMRGDKAPAHWEEIPKFPVNKFKNREGEVVTVVWKAPPEMAGKINNYLNNPDATIHTLANLASISKNFILSSGIPGTGINAHGIHIAVRNMLGRGIIRGGPEAIRYMVRPGHAAKWLEANTELAVKAVKYGLKMTTEEHIMGSIGSTHLLGELKMKGENPMSRALIKAANKIKLEAGATKLLEFHGKYFEDPLFQKMLPALKLKQWKVINDNLVAKGMSERAAGRAAAKTANELYGGINWEELGQSRTVRDLMRATILAPDWAESNVRLGIGVVKALRDPTNPKSRAYQKVMGGLMGMYTIANVVNYTSTGHMMWQNDPGHAFDVSLGKSASGKMRYWRPFGTAADFARLPVDVASAIYKGDAGAGFRVLLNRTSVPLRVGGDILWNKGKDNRAIFGKDAYGNKIPMGKQLGGLAGEVSDLVVPQYGGAIIDFASGRTGIEEAVMRGTEMPFRYSAPPKPISTSRTRRQRPRRGR